MKKEKFANVGIRVLAAFIVGMAVILVYLIYTNPYTKMAYCMSQFSSIGKKNGVIVDEINLPLSEETYNRVSEIMNGHFVYCMEESDEQNKEKYDFKYTLNSGKSYVFKVLNDDVNEIVFEKNANKKKKELITAEYYFKEKDGKKYLQLVNISN